MDAYFDVFSGISGNMVLGALIDLGVDKSELEEELKKLGISNEYKIKTEKVDKQGIGGTYVEVELLHDLNDQSNKDHKSDHDHKEHKPEVDHSNESHSHNHKMNSESSDHSHTHSHNSHKHGNNQDHNSHHQHDHSHDHHSHNHDHNHDHSHGRTLSDINELIDNSSLSSNIKEKSKNIFLNLAKAEGKIHGKDIDEIHFHEVGAVDAIVDIVGSVIGLDLLGIDTIYASRLNTGTGFVNCEHGKMPVPAPATLELLKKVPVYSTGVQKELITPTGAAIITTLADNFGNRPDMEIEKNGYGAGSYELAEMPNLLRINLGEIKNQKKN